MLRWFFGCIFVSLALLCCLSYFNINMIRLNNNSVFQLVQFPSKALLAEYDVPILSNKWIVVTTINYPTDDLKRLVLTGWNVAVVADKKTPPNWALDGVHYLSVERQQSLGLQLPGLLPFGTYTRKNIGYLYAIQKGAEWIYDTDDDNKPYGLGLDQFDYNASVSGILLKRLDNASLSSNVFNPYSFFGNPDMWPRGFPLEMISNHSNGVDRMVLCRTMKSAAVQQGLVHKDPDVDAIYRLLHASRENGLNESFNKFAPPVTLEKGTYSPWNSQNTLFNRKSFFTMFLPTTVEFRVTDIWRSYFSQKLLHLIGETIAFYPVNAIQIRNAHNYLADFVDEREVYTKSGEIIKTLDNWQCSQTTTEECTIELAKVFRDRDFWQQQDVNLIKAWIEDLQKINYAFPPLAKSTKYVANEQKDVNCIRTHIDFSVNSRMKSLEQRQTNFEELCDFCKEKGSTTMNITTLKEMKAVQNKQRGLAQKADTALIVTANWPWNSGIGVLQRLYEPYFAAVIFCGTWNESLYNTDEVFPKVRRPLNYIHLSQHQMNIGIYMYYCLSKARDLKLQNLEGYYILADDTIVNFWHPIQQDIVVHPDGLWPYRSKYWDEEYGYPAAKRMYEELIQKKYANDTRVTIMWSQFDYMSRLNANRSGVETLTTYTHRAVSDMFYIPTTQIDFVAELFELMHEAGLFLEHALGKLLQVVKYKTYREQTKYLWYDGSRDIYDKHYTSSIIMLHPIKFGLISNSSNTVKQYCGSVIQTFLDQLYS